MEEIHHYRRFLTRTALEPLCFFILSSAGTLHPVHFDGSAFHTVLSTLSGYKFAFIGCPISDTEPTPPNLKDGDPFILMRNERVIIYLVVIRPVIDKL